MPMIFPRDEVMNCMARRKQVMTPIADFNLKAKERGMTYAQAQVEETCKWYQKRKRRDLA